MENCPVEPMSDGIVSPATVHGDFLEHMVKALNLRKFKLEG
jgi:hypothetical protein